MGWWVFHILAYLSFAILLFLFVLVLFEPGLRYRIRPRPLSPDSDEFVRELAALCDTQVLARTKVERLKNGESFFPAMLEAIAGAKQTINLEAYQFRTGRVGSRFVEALAARARAGVRVKLVVDWLGSFKTPTDFFKPLTDAGGKVAWYQPFRWSTFKRWNNRTHRKMLVIDGRVGFAGGPDIADEWLYETKKGPVWRDTNFRFDGNVVSGLQSTFAENWLESSGNILADDDYFPQAREDQALAQGGPAGIVVNSTPSAARGTRAAILFQTVIAYAQKTIHITTPYFVPDRSSLSEILRAAERGVKVIVLTPGKHSDHLITRSSARRRYGELLKSGVEVYEYRPAMIHAKTMVIDGLWSIVGSTNFDNRSLGLNDEVNVALRDRELAGRLEEDFREDLSHSRQITYEHWDHRPFSERVLESLFRVFDRQF